jgi:uncharacterized protein (TIGR00251 family)
MTGPPSACRLAVLISPRARADALAGWQGSDLKVRIAAPPAEGAANLALLKFLAGQLGVNISRLSLALGSKNRRKVVIIEGLTEAETRRLIQNRLAEPPGGQGFPKGPDKPLN